MNYLYRIFYFLFLVLAISCQSQKETGMDYEHPTEMGLEPSTFKMPNPDDAKLTMTNGLTAFVVPGEEVPLVTIAAFINAGSAFDVKAGTAETLTSILKNGGNCGKPSSDFQRELNDLGAEYHVSMDQETTEITLNVASEDLPWAISTLSRLLKSPCINSQTVASYNGEGVQNAVNGIEAFDGNLNVAVDLFNKHIYEGHPYSMGVTAAEAQSVNVNDVTSFHKKYFTPLNVTIAIGGDIDRASVEQMLNENLGNWSGGGRPVIETFGEVENTQQTFTYNADKLQSWIVIGHALPIVSPDEVPALEVMNYILGGGHFDTRLFEETRDMRGLTNDASGFLTFRKYGPGSYDFRTYGRPAVLGQLEEIVLAEVNKMRSEEVSDEELMVAQGALADGVFEAQFQNSHKTAMTFAIEFNSYQTFDHLKAYPEKIRAVTKAEVKAAANKFLKPDQFVTVKLVSK